MHTSALLFAVTGCSVPAVVSMGTARRVNPSGEQCLHETDREFMIAERAINQAAATAAKRLKSEALRTDRIAAILEFLEVNGPTCRRDLAKSLGFGFCSLKTICTGLISAGNIAQANRTTLALVRRLDGTRVVTAAQPIFRRSDAQMVEVRASLDRAIEAARVKRAAARAARDARVLADIIAHPLSINTEIGARVGLSFTQTLRSTRRLKFAGQVSAHGKAGWRAEGVE